MTFVGAASNQLVMVANHDKFPVMRNDWKTSQEKVIGGVTDPIGHCLMTRDTRLNFLADIFDLKDATYSIGDFAILIGEWLQSFCIYVWVVLVIHKLRATT